MIRSLCARLLASGLLLTAGCGPTIASAFSYHFADNQREPTARVARALPRPTTASHPDNSLGVPIAVGTTHAAPRAVIAFDLHAKHKLWSHPINAMTRPQVLGDVVVTSTRQEVVTLDLHDGHELWRAPIGDLAYVGAARGGDVLTYVASVGAAGGARRVGRIRAVQARTGSQLWAHDIRGVLGEPAAEGAYLFVPWERQSVAVLDLHTGIEKTRIRSTDDVISWVRSTPAGVFYGNKAIYRFTKRSASGTKQGSAYRPAPIPDAPRDPLVNDDGFFPKPGTRSARGRIRIFFAPAPAQGDQGVPIADDTFYFVYYRYVFAFDTNHTLRWVRMLDQDVIGSQALDGGLLTVGERGAMHLLGAADGLDHWTGSMNMGLDSVGLDAAGLASATHPTQPEGVAPTDLRPSLNKVALDPDNRLVAARAYAIQLLAAMTAPEITRDLLDLYAQRSMPGTLKEAIATALRGRHGGAQYLVKALDQHYDFLADTKAPPLQIIIPSLLEMHATAAVPGLIQQMQDHETPIDVLPLVIHAVVELGDASVVPALESYLTLYHADTAFAQKPQSLAAAAEGVFKLAGADGRHELQTLMADATTLHGVSHAINALFVAEQHQAEVHARVEAEAAARAAEAAASRAAAARPVRLSQTEVNHAFAEHLDDLRKCVAQEVTRNPHLAQVRVVFILQSDGSGHDFTLAPNTAPFVACMQPKLAGIRFPAFQATRQRASFTLDLHGGEQAAHPSHEPAANQSWWARNEQHAASSAIDMAAKPFWVQRPAAVRPTEQLPTTGPELPPGMQVRPTQHNPQQQNPQQHNPQQHNPQQQNPQQQNPQQHNPQQQNPQQQNPQQQNPQQQNPQQHNPQQQNPPNQWWVPQGG